MKRPALCIGFPYILGLVTASVIAGQFRMFVCIAIVLLAICLMLLRRTVWKYVLFSTLSCLIACCSYWHHETMTIEKQMIYAGKETSFTGQVTEQTVYENGYAEYILKGCFPDNTTANIKLYCENQNLNYGDEMIISGVPARIRADYVFDSAEYYQAKNIFLEFDFMTEILEVNVLEYQTLRSCIYHWKASMIERILAYMDAETGAMLTGMLFGDKSGMSRATKKALYRTGIGHILAVSGLHLDFLAGCMAFLLKKCKAGRKLSFGMIAVLCSLFVICAGETVSVKRACIMILISQGAKVMFRESNSLNSLAIAMLFLGIENPFVVHSSAFWLSCSGAFGIGVIAKSMTKLEIFQKQDILRKIFKELLSFCWVFVIILPVSAFYFREISLISPLSNLLLVPVCMLALILGFAAIAFGCHGFFAELCLSGANMLNALVLRISDFLAGLSWTHASTDSEVLLFLLIAGIILVVCCQICFHDKILTSISVGIALIMTCVSVYAENVSQMYDLNIAVLGSGKNCVLAVRQGTDAVLIDMSGTSNQANYASVYLEQKGVQNLEALYLCNPKEKSISNYQKYITYPKPEHVFLMKESEHAEDSGFTAIDYQEFLFHGALLIVEEGKVRIAYEDKVYICTSEKKLISETPDILTVYGKSENVLPDCGILIVLDENSCYHADSYSYIGENNLEITIAENGRCRVRRLYGDS